MMKKMMGTILTLSLGVVLAGCGQNAAEMEPQEVLREMTQRALEVKTEAFEGQVKVEVTDDKGEGMSLDLSMKGKSDKTDWDNQKSEMEISFDGRTEGETDLAGNGKFGFVQMGKEFFFKLDNLNLEGEEAVMINQLIAMFSGQWFKVSADMLPEGTAGFLNSGEGQEELAKKMKELATETDFFKLVKDDGMETVNGMETRHLEVTLDRSAAKQFLSLVASEMGQTIPETDLQALDMLLDSMTEGISLWIAVDDFDLMKMKVMVMSEIMDETAGSVDLEMDLEMEMTDQGEEMKIEAPEGAQEFNPLAMMGGMGMNQEMMEGLANLEGMGEE